MCNGILAGLVSVTAGCATVPPWAGFLMGGVGGGIYRLASHGIRRMGIDDPLDAAAVVCGQARGVRAPRRRGGRECERRAQPEEAYRLGSPRTPHCHVQAHKAHRLTTRQPLVQFEAVTLSRWLRASHLRAARPQARGDEEPAGRASCTRELGAWLPSGATHEANDSSYSPPQAH